jgi:histidine phosphotransfer protein HptB
MNERITVKVERDLEELIPIFLSTRQQDLDGLAKGLAAKDFQAMRMIGHGMKGSGSSFGFHPVSTMGAAIESAAIAEDVVVIGAQFEALRDYLSRVDISYQ